MTPAGIEPATFRIVAQHLNDCANGIPKILLEKCKIYKLVYVEFCGGVDIKLEPYLEWQYIEITVYKMYRN